MLTPHHSSFSHSGPFQKKTPIYIRVYISLSLLRGGADLYIEGAKKSGARGEGAKRGPAEGRRRAGRPQEARVQTFPPWAPPWGHSRGGKRPYGLLRAKRGRRARPSRRGENREGGVSPAAEGGKRTGTCPGRPQEARVQPLPPQDPSLGATGGRKTALRGSQGKHGRIAQGKTQQETCPREGKSSKGRGAGRKPPKTRPHWRSEARRAPFRGRQAPFLPLRAATSPSGLRKAQEGPARHSGSGSPPQSHAGLVLAARRRGCQGRDAPFPAGPGGKNKDTPGPSARRPRAPDGSHHEGRRPAGPAGQPAISSRTRENRPGRSSAPQADPGLRPF